MAIAISYEDQADAIFSAMLILNADWPSLNLFRWAEGDTLKEKASWVSESAYWWAVWDSGEFQGVMAAVDMGHGRYGTRWAAHFASRRHVNHQKVFLKCWKSFLSMAQANGVGLIAAYIPVDRGEISRLAKIMKFRKFGSLWVLVQLQS